MVKSTVALLSDFIVEREIIYAVFSLGLRQASSSSMALSENFVEQHSDDVKLTWAGLDISIKSRIGDALVACGRETYIHHSIQTHLADNPH